MSDSELSEPPVTEIPPDSVLEASLRDETKKAARLGDSERYTVKNIRSTTEAALSLPTDFFKDHEIWKARSKEVIQDQVEQENAVSSPKVSKTKPKAPQKALAPKDTKKTTKRSSADDKRPTKKPKIESDEESALSSPPNDSEHESGSDSKSRSRSKSKKIASPRKDDGAKKEPQHAAIPSEAEDDGEGSGSEMSVVLDAEPVRKRQPKSKGSEQSGQKAKSSKSNPKVASEADPDQEEIKRLQGWLVKCGVRKVWGKELKPYETPKAKIKHLKQMLAEVGMTGRFSNEKASQIKEARELAADIEAVQEGNERWGKSGSDNEDGDDDSKTRGGRRLVRGAKNYDFLSSDGEETD